MVSVKVGARVRVCACARWCGFIVVRTHLYEAHPIPIHDMLWELTNILGLGSARLSTESYPTRLGFGIVIALQCVACLVSSLHLSSFRCFGLMFIVRIDLRVLFISATLNLQTLYRLGLCPAYTFLLTLARLCFARV